MRDSELIASAVRRLEELGLGVRAKFQSAPRNRNREREIDGWLTLESRGRQQRFAIEAKRALTSSALGAVIAQLKDTKRTSGLPCLLVSDYVSAPAAETLRKQEQPFLDVAGNCYLRGEGLLVIVAGRKPVAKLTVLHGAHAFSPSGLKLLFALIADPKLAAAPQRTIAAAAGVALGSVPKVLADLRGSGRLLESSTNRRLTPHRRLLDEWAMGYAQQIRPKTLKETYTTPTFENWKRWDVHSSKLRWGAEPAAHLLVGHLRPGLLTLWGESVPSGLKVEQRLKPAASKESGPLLELRMPFWGKTLRLGERNDIVPPALVYAELLASGDARCMETAEIIHERYLARLFPGT